MGGSESAGGQAGTTGAQERRARARAQLQRDLDQLAASKPFAKGIHQTRIFGLALKLMREPDGFACLYGFAPQFDQAGLFHGGDWAFPASLQPALVRDSLRGAGMAPALECLSELRFLAIAMGDVTHPQVHADDARRFLEAVLALNLDLLFPDTSSEEARTLAGPMTGNIQRLFRFIADSLSYDGILASLVMEAERLLLQRPIMIGRVRRMIETAARTVSSWPSSDVQREALILIHALEGPTELSRECGDEAAYERALEQLDFKALRAECRVFAQTMLQTGLVCPLHATLLRFLNQHRPMDLSRALGLGTVGRASFKSHYGLVRDVIETAVHPATARCIYGLSRLLERGTLFFGPVAPGLRRLIHISVLPAVAEVLHAWVNDTKVAANAILLSGTLSVLGQPLGVDQGDNPTCQSARAISLWAQNDAGFLLELIASAARDGEVVMPFEGVPIASGALTEGLAKQLHNELDPVSLVLVPHLDRIYIEMARRTIGREGDGHQWVNPELHGWWVHRGFAGAVDPQTESVVDLEAFLRLFYATYHPDYNGGAVQLYPQPAGAVVTNIWGGFVGWHAVSIQRVGRGPDGDWRVYFYNPNRDAGQDWGQGIVSTTSDHYEFEGEASLPFHEFAARLYVFHYDASEHGDPLNVPVEPIAKIVEMVAQSWARHLQRRSVPSQ